MPDFVSSSTMVKVPLLPYVGVHQNAEGLFGGQVIHPDLKPWRGEVLFE